MRQKTTSPLLSWFQSFLGLAILALLFACAGGGAPGGGLGGGNFANAPAQESGVAAADVNVLDGEFIKVRTVVTPTGGAAAAVNASNVNMKGQLIDKTGANFSKSAAGRTVRIYEPTLRQFIDRPIQQDNSFETNLDVLAASFDPATQKTKLWCFFAVPLGFNGTLASQATPCTLPAPDCFPLDNTWFDFLNEDYINDPCPLLNKAP